MNMGRQGVEEGVSEMLKEVRKVVEQGKEMKVEEEARGIPKPSFLANLMAIQELHVKNTWPFLVVEVGKERRKVFSW